MGDLDDEEEEDELPECNHSMEGWVGLLHDATSTPEAIAEAWLADLDAEARARADEEPHEASTSMRTAIFECGCAQVEVDRNAGFKRMGSIMRALDICLGCKPLRSAPPAHHENGNSAPIEVLHAEGTPGTLGLWWSNLQDACDEAALIKLGVTHRLNMAAECVDKFGEGSTLPTVHVPMEDTCSMEEAEENEAAETQWLQQMPEVLMVLRQWQQEGAVVNVNCKMGKNRSGVALLLWLVGEEGWQLSEAVEHLREINFMALGNPVLLTAAAKHMGAGLEGVPMLPGGEGEGSGWISISPPPSPR